MDVSVAGLLITLCACAVGVRVGGWLTIAMFASIPFGATAIGTLGATTPLISCLFAGLLVCDLLYSPANRARLIRCINAQWTAQIVVLLCLYGIAGAAILPNLFEGDTNVFTPVAGLTEVLRGLAPVKGNLSQTIYFLLSAAMYFVFAVALDTPGFSTTMHRGFMLMSVLQAALGMIDLAGNLTGMGDVLAPIRTAAYEMHTDEIINGFPRICGAYSETSLYSAGALPALAYTLTYGRYAGSTVAFALSAVLFLLLALSTSTTAYAGLAVLALFHFATVATTFILKGFRRQDVLLLLAIGAAVTLTVACVLVGINIEAVGQLLTTMVLEKGNSESAEERSSWNVQAIQALSDTSGIGIGLGSTRTSGFLFALLAQLGVFGAVLFAILFAILLLGARSALASGVDQRLLAMVRGAQAAAVAAFVANSISGPNADPTPLFFIALAAVGHVHKLAAPKSATAFESRPPARETLMPRPAM